MEGFDLIEITGATAYDRGLCYGHKARGKIGPCIDSYKAYFSRRSRFGWERLRSYAAAYVPVIEAEMPELVEEAKGISAGAGVEFEDVMVVNCRYEITKQPEAGECTTAAVLPRASGNGTLMVKNWDYRAGIMGHIVVLHIVQPDGTRILGLSEAGQLIREGFNSHGIGLCNNALKSVHDGPGTGIPVTFLRRKTLACSSFEAASQTLVNAKRSVSNNMLLASSTGEAVDIEAHPLGCDIIEPVADIIVHANHFTVHPEIDRREKSPRDGRLRELLVQRWGDIDVEYIKSCVRDHRNYPECICSHPRGRAARTEDLNMTVASMVIDFADESAHICIGPPCEGNYLKYSL